MTSNLLINQPGFGEEAHATHAEGGQVQAVVGRILHTEISPEYTTDTI
jgi:hypothetical protein